MSSTPTSPGFFIFRDQPDNPQRVRVKEVDGELVAEFDDMEPGDELLRVADMQGTWEPGFPWRIGG